MVSSCFHFSTLNSVHSQINQRLVSHKPQLLNTNFGGPNSVCTQPGNWRHSDGYAGPWHVLFLAIQMHPPTTSQNNLALSLVCQLASQRSQQLGEDHLDTNCLSMFQIIICKVYSIYGTVTKALMWKLSQSYLCPYIISMLYPVILQMPGGATLHWI